MRLVVWFIFRKEKIMTYLDKAINELSNYGELDFTLAQLSKVLGMPCDEKQFQRHCWKEIGHQYSHYGQWAILVKETS